MSFVMGTSFNWIIIAVTVFLVYIFMLRGYQFGVEVARETLAEKSNEDIIVSVESNDTPEEVAAKLEKEGVIANALLFRLENMLKGSDTDYVPGEHTVKATMSISEINAVLRGDQLSGPDKKITILEGFSLQNIGNYLESNEIISAEAFLQACNQHTFQYPFLQAVPKRENQLEGYLFPDTYFITNAPTADEIITRMLDQFENVYSDAYAEQAAALNLTMDQVIIVASIIEKEISRADERALAAALIYNRLQQNMNLEMITTLLYVLEKRKDRLTEEDLQLDSPYNTFVHPGLPKGPICNPGRACIEAALYPADSDVLYFALTNEGTGQHTFYATAEEYEQAKAQ
jgi:UPF0755 protein